MTLQQPVMIEQIMAPLVRTAAFLRRQLPRAPMIIGATRRGAQKGIAGLWSGGRATSRGGDAAPRESLRRGLQG
jgi:hypothetical protein